MSISELELDSKKEDSKNEKMVFVEYKIKNKNKVYQDWFTLDQYENLKEADLVEYCKIIKER